MTTIRVRLTAAELIELRRALVLIMNEDGGAEVNMEPAAVRAKAAALAKLDRALGIDDRKS